MQHRFTHTVQKVIFAVTLFTLNSFGAGCNCGPSLNDLASFFVPINFTVVDLKVDEAGAEFNSTTKFDLNTNSSFADNKAHITGVNINKVFMKLVSQPGNMATTLLAGEASVSELDLSNKATLQSFSNTSIASLDGVETQLTLDPAGKTKLEQLILQNPNSAVLGFEGTTDVGPVKFLITFRLDMAVTVNP